MDKVRKPSISSGFAQDPIVGFCEDGTDFPSVIERGYLFTNYDSIKFC
jgi:hypothetical protein